MEVFVSSFGFIGDIVMYFDIRRNGNVFFFVVSVKIFEIFGVIRLVNFVDLEMIIIKGIKNIFIIGKLIGNDVLKLFFNVIISFLRNIGIN